MNKFIFKKNIKVIKTSAGRYDDIILNPKQWENEQLRLKAVEKRKETQTTRKKREEYNESPFVLITDNPSYKHTVNDIDENNNCVDCNLPIDHESHQKEIYELIHSSLPHASGENRAGGEYARQLKQLLRNSDDWERTSIPRSQYANNKDIINLAPKNIEAYRKRNPDAVVSTSAAKLMKTNKNSSTIDSLTTPSSAALEPDTVENIVKNHGNNAIAHLLNAAIENAPYKVGGSLCAACGEEVEHPNHKVHEFLPQEINDRSGYLTRLLGNPLLKTKEDEEGMSTAFGSSKGPRGNYMSMVHFSANGDKIDRYTTEERLKKGQRTINNYVMPITSGFKPCECGTGKLRSSQRDNLVNCRDCEKGNITEIESKDDNGNTILVPHTEGLGNGNIKQINPDTASTCETCRGEGTIFNGKDTVRCPNRNCSGGKDLKIESCKNCNSNNSSIRLTPYNVCLKCNGTKIIREKTTELPSPRVIKNEETHEGMATVAMPLYSLPSTNTEADAYSHLRNPECTNCTTDDQDFGTGIPCHCHARSAADPNTLPPGTRLFHKGGKNGKGAGFLFPKRDFQHLLVQLYGKDQESSPHSYLKMDNLVDPLTNMTAIEQYRGKHGTETIGRIGDKPIDQKLFLGMYKNGIRVPQKQLNEAIKQSEEHWKAPNAYYTAPSKDLELARKLVYENAHTWPDIIPAKYLPGAPKKKEPSKLDSFPESMHEAVTGTEDAIKTLPDAIRFNPIKEKVYDHILNNKQKEASIEINKMLEMVERFHGTEKAKEIASTVSKLPVTTDIKWSLPKKEEVSNE
jgi:hypothetical protein